ncbi:MAG: hypothetical protein ABI693_15675 [Bryobacteraceae bacterium]
MTRSRRIILGASLVLGVGIVAACAFCVMALPYASESVYLEAKRWIGAAVWVDTMPKDLAREAEYIPCRPSVQAGRTASPHEYFPPGVLGCSDRQEAVTTPAGKHGTTPMLTLLHQSRFWEMPSHGNLGGTDGAQWIVEDVSEGRYHIVDRWSPPVGDPVRTLGMTLVTDLAQAKVAPDLVY